MNMNLNEELIMIISSCEAYSDLWGNHVTCLKKYWPNRCINSIIVTDKNILMILKMLIFLAQGIRLKCLKD